VGKDYEQAFVDHQKLIASTSTAAGYFLRISEREKEMFNWISFIFQFLLWIARTLATSQD
jgi:hypothetical protein